MSAQSERPMGTVVIIQWTTWEREEWEHEGKFYNIMENWYKHLPPELEQRYHEWIKLLNPDDLAEKSRILHDKIYDLHCVLKTKNIPHLFFNGNNHFEGLLDQRDWGVNYMNPYDSNLTYDAILRQTGYKTVNEKSWHFGEDAHRFWAQFMLKYVYANNLIS